MFAYTASSIAFAQVSLEEACARIAALGLKCIDLWFVKGMCEHLPPDQTNLDLPRIRRALEANGLRCHALSVYGTAPEVTLARLEQLAELGGKVLVRDSRTKGHEQPGDVVERMRAFVQKAERLGIVYAPENHGNTAFDRIEQIEEVLEAVPSSHCGVAYAPIHTHKCGEDPAAAIRALGPRIPLYYAWDWGPSGTKYWKDPAEQLPGTGVLDFPAMFRALKETGHRQPLCLFAHGIEHWPAQQAEDGLRRALAFCRKVEKEIEGKATKARLTAT